jgi:hypothetical protein
LQRNLPWFDQSRFCWFLPMFMQKMVVTGKKRRNKNYKQNAKYGDSNYAFKNNKNLLYKWSY